MYLYLPRSCPPKCARKPDQIAALAFIVYEMHPVIKIQVYAYVNVIDEIAEYVK